MYKKLLLSCGLVLGCFLHASAQKIELSVEGGLQQSWIPTYIYRYQKMELCPSCGYTVQTYNPDISYGYDDKLGGYFKGVVTYAVGERLQVYNNFSLNQLRFKPRITFLEKYSFDQTYRYPKLDNYAIEGTPYDYGGDASYEIFNIQSDDRIDKTTIIYLSQEMGVRYKALPRLWVYGGVDVSYRIYSQIYVPSITYKPIEGGKEPSGWYLPGLSGDHQGTLQHFEIVYGVKKDTSGKGFNNLLLGTQLGAAYDLSDKFALSLSMQHSLTSVYEANNTATRKAKANLFRLGLQYRLKSW